jgi:Undecaprenyl-phosphate galactose phosphotransferase WbaP
MISTPITTPHPQPESMTPRASDYAPAVSGTPPRVALDAGSAALRFSRVAGIATVVSLLATDVAAVLVAGYGVRALRYALMGPMPLTPEFFAAAVVWVALRAFYGLYPGFGVPEPEALRLSVNSTTLAALAHGALLFASKAEGQSRFIALGSWVLLIPIAWIARESVRSALIRARLFGRPVAVLGGGPTGALLVREMRQNPGLGLVPVAIFEDEPALHGGDREGVPVLGAVGDASTWQPAYPVREAIVAIPRSANDHFPELILALSRRFARVMVVSDTFGHGTLWARSQAIGVYSTLQVQNHRFERSNLVVKRALDLVLGVPLFLMSLPVIAVAAVLVKCFSPGSAFFCQSREGLNGKAIRIWKIRTMVPDADRRLEELLEDDSTARLAWQQRMKLDHDPRIVKHVGRFLRRSSIDELPQLWNVIRGDMSLVGPRPFPNYHLDRFPPEFRELRHQVPPGITGYWQVTHRSEASLTDQQATDRYYIHNWSLWLDLWILFRTAGAVLDGKGAW